MLRNRNFHFYSSKNRPCNISMNLYFALCEMHLSLVPFVIFNEEMNRIRVIFIQMQIHCFIGECWNASTLPLLINWSFKIKGFIFNETQFFFILSVVIGDFEKTFQTVFQRTITVKCRSLNSNCLFNNFFGLTRARPTPEYYMHTVHKWQRALVARSS